MKIPSRRSRAAITVVAAAILASGALGGMAPAATGDTAPGPVPAPYPYPGTVPPTPPPIPGSGGAPTVNTCTPFVNGDNVHGPTSGDASGHGWWYRNNCTNVKATVYIGLQEYFSDGTWHNQGAIGSKYVYPGGGSANWANARQVCEGFALAGWRSYVYVTIGNGASAYTPAQNLNCTHW